MEKNDLLAKLDSIPHVHGKSLRQHGESVASILKHWDMPSEVILAGLYHSVYGRSVTRFVPPLSLMDRQSLIDIVGVSAERLIFLNCVHRPDSFWSLFHKSEYINLRLDSYIDGLDQLISHKDLVFLLHINLANILDHIDPSRPLSYFKSSELSLFLQYSNYLFDKPRDFLFSKFSLCLDV